MRSPGAARGGHERGDGHHAHDTGEADDPALEDQPPLRFPEGKFAFYTAEYGSWAGDARIVFRVRVDRDPHERAAEKGIRHFHRLVPSWPHEIGRWLIAHPDHPIA